MRFIKQITLGVLGLAMVLVGVANMAPVDIYLLPPEIGGPDLVLRAVPLSVVMLGAAVGGILIGYLLEWLREAHHRRLAAERKREVNRLRGELARLGSRLGDVDEDLPELNLH
ncbi:MAG: LapA family protein [Pseudomonadota bacterium]